MSWFRKCDTRDETIATQRQLIEMQALQIEELKALFNKTSNFEIVDQDGDGVTMKLKPLVGSATQQPTGRAGFRSRRVVAEAKTVPEPNDSVAALEKRVAEAKRGQ